MGRNQVIYGYPLVVDIVVALLLFVGRHSLASWGFDERTVGSVLLYYGIGYCLASLLMRHVIHVRHARWQMSVGLLAAAVACVRLATTTDIVQIKLTFALLPVAISLFFNAYQAFMLDVATGTAKPLAAMAGHYTFAWSLGYAFGPFVSGLCRQHLDWRPIYLVAAALAVAVALLALLLAPAARGTRAPTAASAPAGGPSMVGISWLGVVLAWAGWNALSTYWPVQAQQLGFTAYTRGGVEFAVAMAQALGALALVYAGAWHHRPWFLALFGALGAAGVAVFAGAQAPLAFVAGALLYGLYTSSSFSYMVYHSNWDPARAVRRVALNETFVGLSFLVGPVLARAVRAEVDTFAGAYAALAVVLAAGIAVQTHLAVRLSRAAPAH